jgi:hypothetical protein
MNIFIPLRACALAAMGTMAGSAIWADEHSHHRHDGPAPSDRQAAMAAGELPNIRIISPAEGAKVDATIALVLETRADLSRMTVGAQQMGAHLHVSIDSTSLMPTMEDLVRIGKNQYRYVFALPVEPGKHTVSVYWADAQHKTLDATVRKVGVAVGGPENTKRP